MTELRQRWEDRYHSGHTPWDTGITPPEVVAFWQSGRGDPTGLALDLGCGTGTNVRYLAGLGLRAIGVDLAGRGLVAAHRQQERLSPALRQRTAFVQADVSQLPFVDLGAGYILDIGCFHAVPPPRRAAYVAGVAGNLTPGGFYQLFAFDHVSDPADPDPERAWRGLAFQEVQQRFAGAFTMIDQIEGKPDRYPCRWYLLRRAG